MAERKRMTSVLSRLESATLPEKPAEPPKAAGTRKKQRLFDLLNASSPLDAEPNLARIAHEVSTFASPAEPDPVPRPETPPEPVWPAREAHAPAEPAVPATETTPTEVPAAAEGTEPLSTTLPRPDTAPVSRPPKAARPVPATTPTPTAATGTSQVTSEMVRPNGQTVWTDHMVGPKGQTTTRSDQAVRPLGPTERSDQTVTAVRPDGLTVHLVPDKPLAKTRQQKAVFGYLAANPNILTSVNNLSEILTIPPTTLRKTLALFERAGVIRKTRIGNDGLKIVFANPEWSNQMVRPYGHTARSDHFPSQKDRKEDLNLSLSLEDMTLHWPNLVRMGFGPEQLEHIRTSLAKVGKTDDRVIQGLDHIEYELANGLLVDKDGQPVLDPCSWTFRALAQNGYYRRPKGYVSPSEQAALDAEAEARAVHQARQRQEQTAFEAWKAGLTPEALRRAMVGHPGGPKDVWLRAQWKKRGCPDGAGEGRAPQDTPGEDAS